jgi:hypothetical protein
VPRWDKRDDADLRRLYGKAGRTDAALLERLHTALKNKPRRGGRRKGAVSAASFLDEVLRDTCERYKRAYGWPYKKTIEWFFQAPVRAREVLTKYGLKGVKPDTPHYGASVEAIVRRLSRKAKKDI